MAKKTGKYRGSAEVQQPDNPNKVPQKQWREWSEGARGVFNGLYAEMLKLGPNLMAHPETEMPPHHWETIAWNAAWLAAEQVDDPGVVHEVRTQVVKKGERSKFLPEGGLRSERCLA